MCGICGYILFERTEELNIPVLKEMRDSMVHRGPDDAGIFESDSQNVALGHRRLSIIDLSPLGHQPMANDNDDIIISYNGEVYNFPELRVQLIKQGYTFRSKTDTEVVLKLYEAKGESFLEDLNGIFALAIWDKRHKKLIVARDRFGVKPLYYVKTNQYYAFASEMKALLKIPKIETSLNHNAVFDFLRFVYVPGENTGIEGINKLKPGTAIVFENGNSRQYEFGKKWLSNRQPKICTEKSAEEVRDLLKQAVKRQLIADVPVGLFLSGGLDSSAILGLMAQQTREQIESYSVGFSREDLAYETTSSDLDYAQIMADKFATNHHATVLRPDLTALMPKIIYHMDDLFADAATIPTYLISEQAAGTSTVLLSGQGADEIYGGYPWHLAEYISGLYASVPSPIRHGVMRLADGMIRDAQAGKLAQTKRRIKKFAANGVQDHASRVIGFVSHLRQQEIRELLVDDLAESYSQRELAPFHHSVLQEAAEHPRLHQSLIMDMNTLLPDMNLMYTDKLSMAHSIEARVPFLDNDVVDHAFSIPVQAKVKNLKRKQILKKAMEGVVPHEVIYRKKAGFGSPLRSWLQKDLKPMTEDLLSEERIRARGFFKPATVNRFKDDFYSGRVDRSQGIFSMLCFELWCQTFLDKS
jgi:asparagine synthase (glutamine-hydrolysing)